LLFLQLLSPTGPHETISLLGAIAMAAIAFGILGIVFGVLAFVSSKHGNLILATLALAIVPVAAGLGAFSTMKGRSDSESWVSQVRPRAEQERARRGAHLKYQNAALVGFSAGLIPLLLGGAIALSARFRDREPGAIGDERITASAIVSLAAVGSLFVVGAGWIWALPPPTDRYAFDQTDDASWRLAIALDTVISDPQRGCAQLDGALNLYWRTNDRTSWPRRFAREPEAVLGSWREFAPLCVRRILALADSPDRTLTPDLLLVSPLLIDEATRAEVLAASEARRTRLWEQ
jgi:hypothetical protein